MSTLEQHKKMQKLVVSKTIVPGIFREENGVKIYMPISQEQYNEMIENGNFENLAYNTYSMGRGIFTLGSNGEIVNFKGVDSRLEDAENIAVGKVNAQVHDVSKLLGYNAHPHGITVMTAPDQASEIRVRGASQLQNLINEKQKLDETQSKDKAGIIKFPKIKEIKAFSAEFCRSIGLPSAEIITEEFIEQLRTDDLAVRQRTGGMLGNYAYICLKYMQDIGMPVDIKNQTWEEYFSTLSEEDRDKIKDIPNLEAAIKKQDEEYELGATFGQTTRILENPFRIMDLAHFVENRRIDSIQAILDYTCGQYEGDYISLYAETMGKNLSGFMNLKLAVNNWSHRQDFSLSGEMCDDAYDDVSKSIIYSKSITEDNKHYKHIMKEISMYYNQIYLFASNMKVIEDAYRIAGREIPEDYQGRFIKAFIENIENRDEILRPMYSESTRSFEEILRINGGKPAIRNFEGYEEYIKQFREKFRERVLEYFSKEQGNMGSYTSTYNTMKRVYDEVPEELFDLMYSSGNIISSEKLPSIEDKIARFISGIALSNEGMSTKEIKDLVLNNELVKRMMEQDEDIKNIMQLWQETQAEGNIAEIARQIAHDYYYSDKPQTDVDAQKVGKGTVREAEQVSEIDETMQTVEIYLKHRGKEEAKGEKD